MSYDCIQLLKTPLQGKKERMAFKSLFVFSSQYFVASLWVLSLSTCLYSQAASSCCFIMFAFNRSHNPMNVVCFCKIHMLNLYVHTLLMIWLGLGTKTTWFGSEKKRHALA